MTRKTIGEAAATRTVVKGSAAKPEICPVTQKQTYLLDQATHPDCPDDLRDRWILSRAILVRPNLDDRRLRRAVMKLRERHDILRLRFDRVKGNWRGLIDPVGDDIVQQIDLGTLEDAEFHAEISRIANASMTLVGPPLFEVIVVKCAERGDVLVLRLHHAITDGHGMIVLFEDLTKLLVGMTFQDKAPSFRDYLNRFAKPLPARAARVRAFWENEHRDLPKAPDVGRKAKGKEPLWRCFGKTEQKRIDFRATPESSEALAARAAALNVPTTAMIYAAHLESICLSYGLERVLFVTHIARTDPALDGYVGDHTHDVLLTYDAAGESGFQEQAQALSARIYHVMDNLPSESTWRGTPYEMALIEDGVFTAQFSVHQPFPRTRQNKSIFRERLQMEPGQEQQMGPYTVQALDVGVRRRIVVEMQLLVGDDDGQTTFAILYDGIGFAEDEVRKIGTGIAGLLQLEYAEVLAS